ncbi:MAG TPA: AAA family ATPase [Roseiarcus sp.]|nr:AAA family ATPase [Roseiarcus sp.]
MRIFNYKGFDDSGSLMFGERFNIITGQNNSGKTALFECLDKSRFNNKPHRSIAHKSPVLNPLSSVEIVVSFTGEEIRKEFLSQNPFRFSIELRDYSVREANAKIDCLFNSSSVLANLKAIQNLGWQAGGHQSGFEFPSPAQTNLFYFIPSADRQSYEIQGPMQAGVDEVCGILGAAVNNSIYVFRAERLNVGSSPIAANQPLQPNATNLASCLLQLQASHWRFDTFIKLVNNVFPSVLSVSVEPVNSNQAEIYLWNVRPDTGRDDLKIKLIDSGTGVGQVLAILYVVLENSSPKTIIIDEPNSFLHPAASKKLLDILQRYDHQYIISTHAPEIISGTKPDTFYLVKWDVTRSKLESLNSADVSEIKKALAEVGVRLSDLFGADRIVWVEGQTEEICIPLLITVAGLALPPGVAVVPVLHTGDFEGKRSRARMAFEIYERLSRANALIPPSIAFIFDREGRSEREISDLKRQGGGRVFVLQRMMYENYLIDGEAIAAVINPTCEKR